jgi:ankyrin repeat protein
LVIAGCLICIVTPWVLIGQQFRQEVLDRALIQAVKKLDAPAVNRLLSEGASANARDTGEPPLTVSRLLQRVLARLKYKPGGVPDGSRKTVLALHLSREDFYPGGDIAECITSADNIAVMLISHGSEINIRDGRQSTPIQIAVYRGFHQTARVLLSRGVDLDARDDCDYTALVLADDEGRKLLLDHNVNVNAKAAGMPPLTDEPSHYEVDKRKYFGISSRRTKRRRR